MDRLQAGIQLAFAVLPWPAALFQPCEASFHDPTFGQHRKRMQLIALDDLNGVLDPLPDAVGKGLAGVAAVDQQALDPLQIRLASVDGPQGAVAVRHHGRGVGKALRVHPDMPLDAGDFLARVVALLVGRVGVLRALRVGYQKTGLRVAPQFLAGLANRFFKARSRALTPSGPGLLHLAKYEYTVDRLGNPCGSKRHWQPLLSRYNTALKTSCKSTVRGLVRLRTDSSRGRIGSNCRRLMSLG